MTDPVPATAWDATIPEKRAVLVRLCAALTGDPEAAKDLAQETLYEAWRLRGRQRGPQPDTEWLAAIARRVYLRWRRAHAVEMARYAPLAREPEAAEPGAAEHCDVQAELDRSATLGPPGPRAGAAARRHPAMQAFWRRHGRIRGLPDRHVETSGLPAVICRTESVTDGSTLEVVLARDTLVPLGVHGAAHG